MVGPEEYDGLATKDKERVMMQFESMIKPLFRNPSKSKGNVRSRERLMIHDVRGLKDNEAAGICDESVDLNQFDAPISSPDEHS